MFSINLVFVDSKTIKRLNKKYRGVDKPTTVLSFFYGFERQAVSAGRQANLPLGEVIICPEEAKKQKISVVKLVTHGFTTILSEIPTDKIFRTGFGRG